MKSRFKKLSSKGFTIIELLIVITILGVLAAGVLIAVNPADKINAANDTRVMADVVVIGRALEFYLVNNVDYSAILSPAFVDNQIQLGLITSGDLRTVSSPPGGYNCEGSSGYPPLILSNYLIRARALGSSFPTFVGCELKSKKYSPSGNRNFFVYCVSKGRAGVSGAWNDCTAPNGGVANPW